MPNSLDMISDICYKKAKQADLDDDAEACSTRAFEPTTTYTHIDMNLFWSQARRLEKDGAEATGLLGPRGVRDVLPDGPKLIPTSIPAAAKLSDPLQTRREAVCGAAWHGVDPSSGLGAFNHLDGDLTLREKRDSGGAWEDRQ